MRISLSSLDPASPLAVKITAAIARDAAVRDLKAKPSRKHAPCPEGWRSEEELQRAIMGMIAAEAQPGVVVFHVPNGGKRGKADAGRLKGMGTLAGIPDLIAIVDGRAHGLEIKTEVGRMSRAQKDIAGRLRRAGAEYEIARSIAGARLVLRRWNCIA